MHHKFEVGQMVRYIGEQTAFSPPYRTIGKVMRISNVGTDYKVRFPTGTVPTPKWIMHPDVFWYSEDELEEVLEPETAEAWVELVRAGTAICEV